MVRIILNGCLGKMGTVICRLAEADDGCEIVAGVDTLENKGGLPFPIYRSIDSCDMPADLILDFSTASAVPSVIAYALEKEIPAVICTTGLNEEMVQKISEASQRIGIFRSANMSLGINLIANILKRYAPILAEANFDMEIVEKHHNQKIDAPSGTALLLADSLQDALDGRFRYVYDRTQTREKRSRDQIGIHSIRGGSIVGEHSVLFAGQDEEIELNHRANSKEIFATGAIKAAKYMHGKGPGLYDMQDIMDELGCVGELHERAVFETDGQPEQHEQSSRVTDL